MYGFWGEVILPAREDKWSEQSPGRRAICAELWKVSMVQSRGRLTLSCANVVLKAGMVLRQACSGRWGIDIPTAWHVNLKAWTCGSKGSTPWNGQSDGECRRRRKYLCDHLMKLIFWGSFKMQMLQKHERNWFMFILRPFPTQCSQMFTVVRNQRIASKA